MENNHAISKINISKTLIIFIAIVLAGFAISVSTAASSYASSSIPIDIESSTGGGKISDTGGDTGWTPPSSGSGGKGNTIAVTIPCVGMTVGQSFIALDVSDVKSWTKVRSGCEPEYKITSSKYRSIGTGTPFMCPVKTVNGFKVKAKGFITTKKSVLSYGTDGGSFYFSYLGSETSYTCVYPPSASLSNTIAVECIISGHTQFVRNEGAGGKRTFNPTKEVFGSISEIVNQGKCVTSGKISRLEQPEQANKKNWGNYTLSAYFKKTRCTAATQTFNGKSQLLYKDCKTPAKTKVVSKRIGMWCGGANPNGWVSGKTWTSADCFKIDYTCDAPPATYDGKTGIVQTLRDGKGKTLKWGRPASDGLIRYEKNWQTYDTIVTGSTPWNKAVGMSEKKKQLFVYDNSFGSWVKKGNSSNNKNSINLGFYSAANPGGTFQIKRQTQFQAEVRSNVYQIASVNPDTGTLKFTAKEIWIATTGNDYLKCTVKYSPQIQAIRTIGDVN